MKESHLGKGLALSPLFVPPPRCNAFALCLSHALSHSLAFSGSLALLLCRTLSLPLSLAHVPLSAARV